MDASRSRPAAVLGCSEEDAARLVGDRTVDEDELEALAAVHYDWRVHLLEPDSYWVTPAVAARILHVPPVVVERLIATHRLSHVDHLSGMRLVRRSVVTTLAARQRRGSWPQLFND
jgi:hypothetical protein